MATVTSRDNINVQFSDGTQARAVVLYDASNNPLITANGMYVQGNVAHDAVDAGFPIKLGGYAKAAAPTAVSADADRVNAWFTLLGQLSVLNTDAVGAGVFGASAALSDAISNPTVGALGSLGLVWNDVTGKWERQMGVVSTVKTITGSTGTIAIWTPASGKKFRLRGLDLELAANVVQGAAGVNTFTIKDGTTTLWQWGVYVDTTATTDGRARWTKRVELPFNGYLSALADNALTVSPGTTLTAGSIRANAWGREE